MNFQLLNIDSTKQDEPLTINDTFVFNVNSVIKRKDIDITSFDEALLGCTTNNININNLASLCTKLEIKYDSFECLDMVSQIIDTIKSLRPQVKFTQNNIENHLEIDAKPYTLLHTKEVIDPKYDIILKNTDTNTEVTVQIDKNYTILGTVDSIYSTLLNYNIKTSIQNGRAVFTPLDSYIIKDVDISLASVLRLRVKNCNDNLDGYISLLDLGLTDNSYGIIYLNKHIRNKLRFLGYADSQINKLAQQLPDLTYCIPRDLTTYISKEDENTLDAYDCIKELLEC